MSFPISSSAVGSTITAFVPSIRQNYFNNGRTSSTLSKLITTTTSTTSSTILLPLQNQINLASKTTSLTSTSAIAAGGGALRDYTNVAASFFTGIRTPASLVAGSVLAALFVFSNRLANIQNEEKSSKLLLRINFATMLTTWTLAMTTILVSTSAGVSIMHGNFNPMASTSYALLLREFEYEYVMCRFCFLSSILCFITGVAQRLMIELRLNKRENVFAAFGVGLLASSLLSHLTSYINSTLYSFPNLIAMGWHLLKMITTKAFEGRKPLQIISVISGVFSILSFMKHFSILGNSKTLDYSDIATEDYLVETEVADERMDFIDFPKDKSKILQIESASANIPHPDKESWGGEDAVFVGTRNFGVFDGVSGAEKLDGYPLYSVLLAEQMQLKSTQMYDDDNRALNLDELSFALDSAKQYADTYGTGASTALVASIGEDGYLRAVNVGDCKMIVVRNNKIVAKTEECVHYFDCPYQLCDGCPDKPKDGTKLKIKLESGDIVILATDGIFDNLKDKSIISCVKNFNNAGGFDVDELAKSIANASREISMDPEAETPYALALQKESEGTPEANYFTGVGGKMDDLACVVALCSVKTGTSPISAKKH